MTKIFESPDKGRTVYTRDQGSSDRVLHSVNGDKPSLHESMMENKLWGNIHRAALTNQALQIALERVKILYALTDHYEERYGNRKNKDQSTGS